MTALTVPGACVNFRPWAPMMNYQAPARSYLTAHDFFCGAGGGALALDAAGVEIAVSVNHWQKAIETHSANFPHHEHDLTDITQVNPARYPYVDIALIDSLP